MRTSLSAYQSPTKNTFLSSTTIGLKQIVRAVAVSPSTWMAGRPMTCCEPAKPVKALATKAAISGHEPLMAPVAV